MKAKSMKLRTLITMHALFKHSDANHRMNTPKLNQFLRPYGLNCTSRVLSDTVRVMHEYGIDVRYKGEWESQGIWIESRPLSSPYLDRLIFAVTTNPHLSKAQATEILSYLKPLVTSYQEDALVGTIDTIPDLQADDMLYAVYAVICEAIRLNRRVLYSTQYIKYDKEAQSVSKRTAWGTLFTPKCLYQSDGRLYMVGYNNTDRKVQAINLKEITDIKLSFKHKQKKSEKITKLLSEINPKDYIPEEKETVIYEGEVIFYCRGQFTEMLHERFGAPSKAIVKDSRCRVEYTVSEAKITPQTLLWLSGVNGYGIRLKGPESLVCAVKDYYSNIASVITDNRLQKKKK